MKPRHALGIVRRFAEELLQRRRIFQVRQHRPEPDQFPFATLFYRRALELQRQEARRDLPEPRRVQARRDIAFIDRPEV